MPIRCPNIHLDEWKSLVDQVGEERAYLAYFRNGSEIPEIETAKQLLVPTIKQVQDEKVNKERQQRRQERLLRVQEIDAELGDVWSNLADVIGAKTSLTGEQRAKLMPVVAQLAKLYTEKYALKGAELVDQIIEHLTSKGVNVDEETKQQITKDYAKEYENLSLRSESAKTGERKGVGDSNMPKVDRTQLQNGKEAERKINEQTRKLTEGDNNVKVGRFAVRLTLEGTDLPTDIKEIIKNRGIGTYLVLSDKQAKVIADSITKSASVDELTDLILEGNIHQSIKGNLLINVHQIMADEYNKATKEGRTDDAKQWADKQIDLYETFDQQKREQAQGLRFLGTKAFMEVIAPYHYERLYERGIMDTRHQQMTNPTHVASAKRASKAAKRVFNEAVDKTIQQSEKDIQKATEKPQVKPDRLKVLKEREKAAIEKLKKSFNVATSGGITSEGIEAIGELAVVYLEEAAYVVGKAAKRLANTLKNMGYDLSEQEALKYFPQEVDGVKIEDKLAEEETQKAAEKLAKRILGEVIDKEAKNDPVLTMLNTLLGKFRERDIKKTKEKPSDIKKIAEAIRNKEQYSSAWEEARTKALDLIEQNEELTDQQKEDATQRVEDAYKRATSFTFTEAQVDRAIKRKMKDLDIRIKDVVKEFYDIRSAERGRLVDALIDEAGLDESQAKTLAEAIERRFDTLISEGKQKIIDNYVGKINDAKSPSKKAEVRMRKDATAELLELISVGAFDSKEFNEAYATAIGIPQITPAHVAEIKVRAADIQKQKEPLMRHKKTQDLLAYMKYIKGIGALDIINSIWYANVLGNVKTQERNLIGGFSGVSARIIADSLTTGKIATPIKGYFRGLQYGWTRFKDVMKEGYAPFSEKIETPGTLELIDTSIIKNPLTKNAVIFGRYVGRLMSGLDLLNATAGKEAYAQVLASEAVNLDRWKTLVSNEYRADIERKIDETLKTDKETVDRFKREIEEDAAEYGYTELDKKLILLDKIDRARDISITEQASRFGVYSTGNVPTYGTLGAMSDLLASIFKMPKVWWTTKAGKKYEVHPLALLAAFTKIAGNVGEMSLNFVPGIGAARIAAGGYGIFFSGGEGVNRFSKYHLELTPREKQTIIGMQVMGALSMAMLFVLSAPGDDDDPFIRVTANGTGDYKKNRSLQDWKEYSIGIKMPNGSRVWIPYKYTPMILPFGLIGNIRDSKRFKKDYADTTELELLAQGLLNMPAALGDMTAIASMAEVINKVIVGIDGREFSALPRNLERTMTGFYTPGIYRDAVDMMEGLWHVGMDEPIKGVPEYDINLLRQRFFGRNPANVIKRLTADGNERTEYVDVYGRTAERKMPWNEVLSVDAEKTAKDKMILNHQKIMGNPIEPMAKSTFFTNYNPDGSTTAIFLYQGDKRQNILWHNFLKRRGEYIVDAIIGNQGLEPDQYKQVMKSAIEDATERAKRDIELELMDRPIVKIKEEQIRKKE